MILILSFCCLINLPLLMIYQSCLMSLIINKIIHHMLFLITEFVFKKSGVFSYLIFCETEKNEEMLDKYVKITDEIKEEMLFIEDKGK